MNQISFVSANERGFTLLEAVVVIFILVVVAGVVVSTTGEASDRAARETTLASMTELRNALVSRYYADVAEMPMTLADAFRPRTRTGVIQGVPVQVAAGPCWRGPYVMHSGAAYRTTPEGSFTPWPGFLPEYGPLLLSLPTPPVAPPAINDAWGRPIVLQVPNWLFRDPGPLQVAAPTAEQWRHLRLVSAGPDGRLDIPWDDTTAAAAAYPAGTQPAYFPNRSLCGDDLVLYLREPDRRLGTTP